MQPVRRRGVVSGAHTSASRGASRGAVSGAHTSAGRGASTGATSGACKGAKNGANKGEASGAAKHNVGEKRKRGGGSSRPSKLPVVGGKGK